VWIWVLCLCFCITGHCMCRSSRWKLVPKESRVQLVWGSLSRIPAHQSGNTSLVFFFSFTFSSSHKLLITYTFLMPTIIFSCVSHCFIWFYVCVVHSVAALDVWAWLVSCRTASHVWCSVGCQTLCHKSQGNLAGVCKMSPACLFQVKREQRADHNMT